ncbi:AAA family ATPase [Bradyrhizobium sp. WYCCWR 12699]|uniref:ATP-dependent nuclease n=1 Tax=Bradyrhizobium sp. WYCCWR 12699 TaxID=3064203 RepID=UPI0028A3A961|nr:AAA family ATPase [Bradyrhizobium sp. WYCCWR 12699]MDT4738123.1 AAA family ATPase [Bradyrhizobium sp. WYCCWR 12699]
MLQRNLSVSFSLMYADSGGAATGGSRAGLLGGEVKVSRLTISNFRGVARGVVHLAGHTLLVGGNNVGKSTVCEALDLVLGPERLYRRPVIDEHDFHCGRYLDNEKEPIEVRIEAVLIDLPQEAELRFHRHLRRWDDDARDFADQGEGGPAAGDGGQKRWALPVVFIGRYDKAEDDFVGNTFFDHPIELIEDDEPAEPALGTGRRLFGREHKRLCGFVFLRTLRTGARALSLQRGSLLDTVLRLGGTGLADMWQDTLDRLHGLTPAIGEVPQLKQIRADIRERMARFVSLAPGDNATAFFASELTRENLREVVRLFIAADPVGHSVPFARLGTGSINLLVFALLTVIAELKEKQSVIFAMEEPEIALPPHTQRRVSRFVLTEMGQAIVTSHSPYVIEQFEPQDIVILSRQSNGVLDGEPIDLGDFKTKSFKTERRQFAEAILGRAVLVVEGASEAALFPEASTILERTLGPDAYMHLDFAGISLFSADGDNAVPKYGPVFKALNKPAYAFYDTPNKPFGAEADSKLGDYAAHWQSPTKGIEALLVSETESKVHRRFLEAAGARDDYPSQCGVYKPTVDSDDAVRALATAVLKARKGDAYGYTALFIRQCESGDQLPATIKKVLLSIDAAMKSPSLKDDNDLFGDML